MFSQIPCSKSDRISGPKSTDGFCFWNRKYTQRNNTQREVLQNFKWADFEQDWKAVWKNQ